MPLYFWHKQPGFKSQTPKSLKEVVAIEYKMIKPTTVHVDVELICLANHEQAFTVLNQSGGSKFALDERKIKKKCPLPQPISI